ELLPRVGAVVRGDRGADVVLIPEEAPRDGVLVREIRERADDVVPRVRDVVFPQLPHVQAELVRGRRLRGGERGEETQNRDQHRDPGSYHRLSSWAPSARRVETCDEATAPWCSGQPPDRTP